MRKNIGDYITVFDGVGNACNAKITSIKNTVNYQILTKNYFKKNKNIVRIAVAPPKTANRFDFMIEKLVELGVDEIILLKTENSERTNINEGRLMKTIIAACKQSINYHLPKVSINKSIAETLLSKGDKLMCYCGIDQSKYLLTQLAINNEVCIYIGPEGDFSPSEVDHFLINKGKLISLGEQRLRTETAAIAATSILLSMLLK